MAQKRKAKEAFGQQNGQLSAFAVAKQAREFRNAEGELRSRTNTDALATTVASQPYNGPAQGLQESAHAGPDLQPDAQSPPRPGPPQLATFRPSKDNILRDDDTCLEIRLRANETVTFVGRYDLEVTVGIATICGSVLRPPLRTHQVYAPSTQSLPVIQARQDGTIVRVITSTPGLRKLEPLSPLFRNIWNDGADGRTFTRLHASDDDPLQRSITALEISKESEIFLRSMSAKISHDPAQQSRIMVVGAKSSGKSTLMRVLSNHLLSWTSAKKVQYLDLDPGQPEFGLPGQLSLVEVSAFLLGPPYTHFASRKSNSHRLIRSHSIAATTFKDDVRFYIACILDLARYIDRSRPLVINTSGWVTGEGAAATTNLASSLSISDLALLDPLEPSLVQSLQRSASQNPNTIFHHLPRQPPRPSFRTAAELRAMQTMSYMHHHHRRTPHPHSSTEIKWSGKPLVATRPWIVSYSSHRGGEAGITALLSHGQAVHPDFLAEVLDGSIVAIVVSAAAAGEPEAKEAPRLLRHPIARTTNEKLPYIPPDPQGLGRGLDPAACECVGFALVRRIDSERRCLHLHTPLAEDEVASLRGKEVVLLRGGFDAPDWAYLEDLHRRNNSSSVSGSVDAGEGGADVDEGARPWVSRREMGGIRSAVWRMRRPPAPGSGGQSNK